MKNSHQINSRYDSEKLLLKAYRSACALKNEIRDKIRRRSEGNWDFCGMRSKGSFILLCFRKKKEAIAAIDNDCGCLQCI